MIPNILAKSYLIKDQLDSRKSLGLSGVEVMLMPDYDKDSLKYAIDNFPVVTYELYHGLNINGNYYSVDLVSVDPDSADPFGPAWFGRKSVLPKDKRGRARRKSDGEH